MKNMGAEIVVGNNDDSGSLERAASGVDSEFAMATPMTGDDIEVRHGKAISGTAKTVGVPHLVYSSMANADHRTGIAHADSKYEIEKHIGELDIPWTLVAPVFFIENALFPWNINGLRRGVFSQALPCSRKLKPVFYMDVGRFVALGIEQPEPFIGLRNRHCGRRIDRARDGGGFV